MNMPNDFLERHVWLCKRLQTSRMREWPPSNGPTAVLSQVSQWLPLKTGREWDFFEIVSDGAGHAEPYWHGLHATATEYTVMTQRYRDELAARIAKERNSTRQAFGERIVTHRDLGRYFSEPIIFCVKGRRRGNYVVTDDHIMVLTQSGLERWSNIARTVLDRELYSEGLTEQIENDLTGLSRLVLWPELWQRKLRDSFLSVVYIQGSIVHSQCGVWAFHVAAELSGDEGLLPDPKGLEITNYTSSLQFIDPAERCLVHAIVAELHQNDRHAQRMADLRFVGRALTLLRRPPRLDVDLYHCLNERFRITASLPGVEVSGYKDIGREIYCRPWEPDYRLDYSRVFNLCVSRLTNTHPEAIARMRHPLLDAARDLFVAKRVDELQTEGTASGGMFARDSLPVLLISHAVSTVDSMATAKTGLDGVSLGEDLTWAKAITTIVAQGRYVRPDDSAENHILYCALWAVACLYSDEWTRLPDCASLKGTDEEWSILLDYCKGLEDDDS